MEQPAGDQGMGGSEEWPLLPKSCKEDGVIALDAGVTYRTEAGVVGKSRLCVGSLSLGCWYSYLPTTQGWRLLGFFDA